MRNILSKIGLSMKTMWVILGLLSAIMMVALGYLEGTTPIDILKLCILILVLLSITAFYVHSFNLKLDGLPYFRNFIIACYFISFLIAMLTRNNDEIHLWMVGGIIIAALFDMHLGLIFTYNVTFFAGFIGQISIEILVYLLIVGTLMCLLSDSMKKVNTLSITMIIVLSIQVTLLLIMNNFMLWDTMNIDAVLSLLSSAGVIGITYGVHYIYEKWTEEKDKGNLDEIAATLEIPNIDLLDEGLLNKAVQLTDEDGNHTLEEVLQLDFPLLDKLKDYSDKIYNQSIQIGEISAVAAKTIHANEAIAKAGGYYHQIGRLEGKQYVEEGIKLAEAYHLPQAISDIIRQHNMNYEKPQSPEAAIVMLTISIMSMKEYIIQMNKKIAEQSQQGETISYGKIVNNVFQMRLAKGSLDQSGLSVKEYNVLKNFYLHME
ncbi:HDIG domain-containing metalloprotein [Anaerocolumna sp.]|uniref:HDIG domain-containing metalloprotein n=1 Tax=Anaerocolumna sp. TaxID=2041569 RepID=UPI0028B06A3C|nr:HDIG domain-containing metalloprotein [Anaerocolumna sp.]